MEESRTSVESGKEPDGACAQSLEAIIESTNQVEHQINLIATAATEQTAASEMEPSAQVPAKIAICEPSLPPVSGRCSPLAT